MGRWLGLVLVGALLVGCGAAAPGAAPTPVALAAADAGADAHAGHDMESSGAEGHGGHLMGDAPFDVQFIDGMLVHHAGAIVMAQQALAEAERPEVRQLAEAIIEAQQAEIAQLTAWRAAWFADQPTGDMRFDMGPMTVAPGDAPFDQRFLEAMIPHHEAAVVMAQQALEQSERDEIRQLADAIIATQQAEIDQMREWLRR